jgi:alcohol dehydrogenase/propanol-preferring alcohol dehydrogenase
MRVPLPLMPIKAITIQGSYVGSLKELHALVDLAKGGHVPAIPIEHERFQNADAALNRLKDGKVTGRIILTAA